MAFKWGILVGNNNRTAGWLSLALLSALAVTSVHSASPDTQLIEAAKVGDLAEVQDALAAGARINTPQGPTALLVCLGTQKFDHTSEIVKTLLEHGADVNAPGQEGVSAFQQVVRMPHTEELLPLFMSHHPDVRVVTKEGDGVVAMAIQRELPDIARLMVDQGAPVDTPNVTGITPLMCIAKASPYRAWREPEYVELAKYLLSKGADSQRVDKSGKSPAAYAIENNYYDLLLLLDTKHQFESKYAEVKKAGLNQKLSTAIARNLSSKVKMIGGPKEVPVDTIAIITSLLKEGADPNAQAIDHATTILGQALGNRSAGLFSRADSEVIKLLLSHGADVNHPFSDGYIPLALAVTHPEIFELLLAKGANPNVSMELQALSMDPTTGRPIQGKKIQSLVLLAAEAGTSETMKMLLDRKVDIEQADSEGMTPLLASIARSNTNVSRLLVERGAKTSVKNSKGQTAADLAASVFDIGLLRKLDREGKYATLLAEYAPPANSPIAGDWYIGSSDNVVSLRLDPDGGGILGLREPSRAIGWKATGDGFVLTGFQMMGRFPFPMKFQASLTLNSLNNLLEVRFLSQPGEQTMLFHRKGASHPEEPFLRPSNSATGNVAEQVAAAISQAMTANPQYLALYQSDLTEFPSDAYQFIGLTSLNVDNTKITKVPSEIEKFRLLERVSFRNNKITEIGDGFYNLTNLQQADLSSNRLTSLSPRVVNLKKLTELTVYDNHISELPEGWDKMENLKTFVAVGNRLKKLPATLFQAPKLEVLSLGDNMLSELPKEWGQFGLSYLDLSKNRFTEIPPQVWNIQVQKLAISNNEIKEIPPEISSIASLESLNVSGNLISTIPDLSKTKLQELDLSGNQIKSFPATKDSFPSTLRTLNLSNNQLTEVPDWIYELNLRNINLFGNPMPDTVIRSIDQRIRQAYEESRQKKVKH